MNLSYNIAGVLGYNANIDDDLSAAYNANPSQVAFGHFGIDTIPTGQTPTVKVLVEACMYAEIYDLKNPGASLVKVPL